jgi:hypothetical protein
MDGVSTAMIMTVQFILERPILAPERMTTVMALSTKMKFVELIPAGTVRAIHRKTAAVARKTAIVPTLTSTPWMPSETVFQRESMPTSPIVRMTIKNGSTGQQVSTRGGYCDGGSDGVLSHAEALQCDLNNSISTPANNAAESGATLLEDFVNQTNLAIDHLGSNPGPRYLTLLLGHNDLCSGSINKENSSCDLPDQDPLNYCRTRPEAFEREFRKGLDQLIQIEDLHIGVASLVRVSQLCNFEGKSQCSTLGWLGGRDCGRLWKRVVNLGGLFGYQSGICGSLTYDCSHDRVVDAYQTANTYREILAQVSLEYANLEAGRESPEVSVGGQTVGGVVPAAGVTIAYSDATWYYKFQENELSCCDCFHPSIEGQDKASGMLFGGLECDGTNVCCADGADPYENGLCQTEDTGGTIHPGFFVTGP